MRIDVQLQHRDLGAELARLHRRMRDWGEVLRPLPALDAAMPGHAFRWREVDGEYHVYVEDTGRGVLAGCTVFQRVVELDRHAARHLRSPHSRYADDCQRRGLASAVYRWALDGGLCLVSGPRQSVGAYRLWQSLARSYETVLVDTAGKRLRLVGDPLPPAALEAYDIRMLMLGTGWTLERLQGAAGLMPADDRRPAPGPGPTSGAAGAAGRARAGPARSSLP